MIFNTMHGLPSFVGTGFDIKAPTLPQREPPVPTDPQESQAIKQVKYKLSVATANVQSLGTAGQGFTGKLDYLREQFSAMHLNLMGVQESRASEGMSVKQGVLRLCSGHSQGRWGVELWVHLLQPFAYIKKTALFFRKQDFHVAFRDPRRFAGAHFQCTLPIMVLCSACPPEWHFNDRMADMVGCYKRSLAQVFACR